MSPTLAPGGAFTEVAFPSAPAIIRLPLRDITTEPGLPTVCFPLVFVLASGVSETAPSPRSPNNGAKILPPPFFNNNKALPAGDLKIFASPTNTLKNLPGPNKKATVAIVVIPPIILSLSNSPFINLVS